VTLRDSSLTAVDGPVLVDSSSAAPAQQLAPLVTGYHGNRYQGLRPGTHLGLPSRNLTVVVSLGATLHIAAMPDRTQAPRHCAALAAGLHTGPAVIAHNGSEHVVSLELTPAGARSLLGLPAGELVDKAVDLEELLGGQAMRELTERLAAAPDWPGCFAILDDVLTRRAAGRERAEDSVSHAWHRIVGTGGTVRIGDLADDVGYSRRQLTKRFTREYGLTPKQAARVVRFERSWQLLRRLERSRRLLPEGGRPSLAEVAFSCGYYDQAHLAREWNDLAGCPPSAWLAAEELPFVQDTAVEPAVPSAA
jgi:AraC-like DNA-binding protein